MWHAIVRVPRLALVRLLPHRTFSTSPFRYNMGAINTGTVPTSSLVQQLREKMRAHQLQAYIVPSEDEHASEYPSDADLFRGYISGFNGSAGCALVTMKEALLFTDGRYFLQASQQLEPGVWTLMKMGEPGVPTWQAWLADELPPQSRIGVDPKVISAEDAQELSLSLRTVSSSLVPLRNNLVAEIWNDRPTRPQEPIRPLPESITGRSFHDKLAELRAEIKKKHAQGFVATMLDEVAWLLNLRGNDVPYNPVFFAFCIITFDACTLYVHDSQVGDNVRQHLGASVQIRPYETFYGDLKVLDMKLLVGKRASWAVFEALGEEHAKIMRSIIVDQKSIKNAVEQDGFREVHIRDGAALVSYFAWLEESLQAGRSVSETEGATQLQRFREAQADFEGLSFTTISSTGPNGAIIHYAPPEEGSPAIDPNDLYVCDSGGHYTFGTTDVTRTLHFGTPTDEQRRCFTRVLQGHIAIDQLVFPYNTTGYVIDALARAPGWRDHLEYRHGTGHGVGHFLNVHEPPMGIGTRVVFNETGLKAGMVLSNEPGYYLDGHWGIRIENLLIVQPHKLSGGAEPPTSKGFLQFEHITLCPIQTKLIDPTLMTPEERAWVNEYHDEVLKKLRPRLEGDERALRWLEKECAPRL
ncbi:Xaa-Pro aminopeptidase [Malassezia nana]|uniref:Xaa-Pro aminopeptidase n=1 Tax=Malassezia nana TaxID=180528 RepID=A0AAF0ELX6_9BASI|nr:Xaa-Pro aminopeptidase [Malassezia nana]